MKIIHRLKQYIELKSISLNAFDKSIKASNGYIGKIIKNDGSLGGDVIERISSVYTDLNLIWLINGTGEMLKSQEKQDVQQNFMAGTVNNAVVHNGAVHHYASIKDAENKIEMLEKDNADQKNNIRILENALKDKDMVIEMLKEKLNREG